MMRQLAFIGIRWARAVVATCFVLALWLGSSNTAHAELTVTYYSHDLGAEHFPHAFLILEGTLEDGTVVNENHGFTVRLVTPAILMGSVRGRVNKNLDDRFIRQSKAQFSLAISDEEYRKILLVSEEWANRKGRSYNLNKRNCVHFVGATLEAIGMQTNQRSKMFKKPKGYLREIKALNLERIEASAAGVKVEIPTIDQARLTEAEAVRE